MKSLQFLQKGRAYKVVVMEEIVCKKITTKKKSSTFLEDNRNDGLKASQESKITFSRFRMQNYKAFI